MVFLSRKLRADIKQVKVRLTAVFFQLHTVRFCRNCFENSLGGVRFLPSHDSGEKSLSASVEMTDVLHIYLPATGPCRSCCCATDAKQIITEHAYKHSLE